MSPRSGPSPEFQTVWGIPRGTKTKQPEVRGNLAVSKLEGGVALGDVERLVGVGVGVEGRALPTWGALADEDKICALRLGWAEGQGLGCVGGSKDGAPVDGLHSRGA